MATVGPTSTQFVQQAFDLLCQGAQADSKHLNKRTLATHKENKSIFADALANILRTLVDKVDAHVLSIRRAHNNSLAIHQLPAEIFIIILNHFLPCQRARIKALERCTWICSSWRSTITSTPALWSVISFHDPPNSVTKALRMSRSLPLDIQIFGMTNVRDPIGSGVTSVINPNILDVCERAVVERWRLVDLDVNFRSQENLEYLEYREAPQLEVLKLKVRGRRASLPTPIINFFGGGCLASRLQVLRLDGVRAPLALLQKVHDLELGGAWLSRGELFSLIQTNGALRRLALAGIATETSISTAPPWPPKSTFQHDRLHEIVFGALDNNSPAVLLPYLFLPSCQTVAIALENQPMTGALSPSAHATLTYLSQHLSCPGIQSIDLKWVIRPGGPGGFRCEAGFSMPGTCKLQFSLPLSFNQGALWAQEAMRMLECITHKMEICLEVEWDEGKRGGTVADLDLNLLRVLGRLPHTRAIVCRSGLEPHLVELLSRPEESSDGSRWLFGGLDEFTYIDPFKAPNRLQLILSMIKIRYSPQNVTGSMPAHPPRRLRSLQLPVWAQPLDVTTEIFEVTRLPPQFQ